MEMEYSSVAEIAARGAERYPERIAIEDGKESLSYRQLFEEALAIGRALSAGGFGGQPLAVCTKNEARYAPLLLGAALAGAYPSPFELSLPPRRLKKMAEALSPAALLCPEEGLQADWAGQLPVLSYRGLLAEGKAAGDIDLPGFGGEELFLLIFTSGSTGTPKAVQLNHRSVILNALDLARRRMPELRHLGAQPPFSFVLSLTCLFGTWLAGGTVHLLPKMLFAFPPMLLNYMKER